MKKHSTRELIQSTESALAALEQEFKPKAEQYFPGPETTQFFKDSVSRMKMLREELDNEPRFTMHLLGSSQNGKSTLINVLMGRKILTEGHVGACSAAVVRCRCRPGGQYRMTVRYVEKNVFLENLREALRDADTAWNGEEPENRRGETVSKVLGRFIGFFGLNQMTPAAILDACHGFSNAPESIEFTEFGETRDIPVTDQSQVDEHLAARGRKAFAVDECILEGPFPEWLPQLELIDMPGTNDIDSFRTDVSEKTKRQVSGLMLVTKGTQLGSDIINWFKDTAILEEVAESTERNQMRVVIVRTMVDEQSLDTPEDAESLWPYLEAHCREQAEHFRQQLKQVVREKFTDDVLVEKLGRFVEDLPVHFVSAKTYRNLTDSSLRTRVINNPMGTPANMEMMARFRRFDMDPANTGMFGLQKTLAAATEEYIATQFRERMESHLEREVDGIIHFFRQKRLGAELQLAGKAKAYNQVAGHVEAKVLALLANTESTGKRVRKIEGDFSGKAAEILKRVEGGVREALEPRLELWSVLHWRTLRALGYKGGRQTTYDGREYDVPGDMAEIYCRQLRATWVEDRDRLIDLICGENLTELVQDVEKIIEEARGYALAQDADMGQLVEARMGLFGKKARAEMAALRADFRKRTEDYESLRQRLAPEIQKILMPTFVAVGNESGTGCSLRMRCHLRTGVTQSVPVIHEMVKREVLTNWGRFIQEACQSTERFVAFIQQWLAEAKSLPTDNSTTSNLEALKIHGEEMAQQAETRLRPTNGKGSVLDFGNSPIPPPAIAA